MRYDNMNRRNSQLAGTSLYTYVNDSDSRKQHDMQPTGANTSVPTSKPTKLVALSRRWRAT